jgi:hypothetical protein
MAEQSKQRLLLIYKQANNLNCKISLPDDADYLTIFNDQFKHFKPTRIVITLFEPFTHEFEPTILPFENGFVVSISNMKSFLILKESRNFR